MRIAFASDDENETTLAVRRALADAGHEISQPPTQQSWPDLGRFVGEAVVDGHADFGVVMCWTGTGTAIAANKVPGVRAALCTDAPTAAGARTWNDANVLVMGLRLTSADLAQEMLDAWFDTEPDPGEVGNIARLEPT